MNAETVLPMDAVKAHLRVGVADEDSLIGLYRTAALQRIVQYLNIPPDTVETEALLQRGDIRSAALILIAHLYENREGGDGTHSDMLPAGVYALLQPHRMDLGV